MFKHPIVFVLLILITLSTHAQTSIGVRYKDLIFSGVKVDKDLSYNPNASKDDKKTYQFDLYQPKNDDEKSRPLIIWMHGGGFKFGCKRNEGLGRELCTTRLCLRGY